MIDVSRSLRVHMARDGRDARTLAEAMWGPWDELSDADRERKRKAGSARIRYCVRRGWIADPKLALSWARAYGITVQTLLFEG